MTNKKLQLYVVGDDLNKRVLIPSRLSRPVTLEEEIEPKISNFSLPEIVLNYWSNTDQEYNGSQSFANIDEFHIITPTFFQRDGAFKLKGELPRRNILLLDSREISSEQLNNTIFNYMKKYSDLAQKWAPINDLPLDGYSLDFKILGYPKKDGLPQNKLYSTVIIGCDVNYYSRK